MSTLTDLIASGRVRDAKNLADIAAQLAGLVRHGHELGATHGDIDLGTVLVTDQDEGWSVRLDQPRTQTSKVGPTDDILAVGRVLDRLSRALPPNVTLPVSFSRAIASMTSSDPAQRPTAAQVELYFREDFPAALTSPSDTRRSEHTRDDLIAQPVSPSDSPARPRRAAVVIASLVLLLGLSSLGYVTWRTLAPQATPAATNQDQPTGDQQAEGDSPATSVTPGHSTPTSSQAESTSNTLSDGAGVSIGPGLDADVPQLHIYGDFQCPWCGVLEEAIGEDVEEKVSADEVHLTTTLMSFLDGRIPGENSVRAANAALCADDHGAFLPFYQQVYANMPDQQGGGWSDAQFVAFGEEVGIGGDDLDTFRSCVDDRTHEGYVDAMQERANRDGVTGTPRLFVNGTQITDEQMSGLMENRVSLDEVIEAHS